MNDTDVSIDERIRSFAASVRGHLDDLPEDELDEILGGLTADLAEQAADNDGVLNLGDPEEYAEELRSAAGLPPRGEAVKRPPLGERFTAWRKGVADGIRRNPFGRWVLDFLAAMQPLWWVLRGFGIYALVTLIPTQWIYPYQYGRTVFPASPFEALLLLAFVVVSVQWGRGLWLPRAWMRHARTAAGILAIVILPLALYSLLTPRVEYIDGGEYSPQGLRLDGVQINNIFAYDAEGNPIDQVQLFTGKGTPLNLYGANDNGIMYSGGPDTAFGMHDDGEWASIPFRDYRGQAVWNIYPLDEARMDTTTGAPKTSTIKHPEPPFQKAPSISSTEQSPTPTPTPGATEPPPTATPAP